MKTMRRVGQLRLFWLSLALLLWGGAATSRAAESRVVINEIMYHPPLDLEDLQYLELFNAGEAAADLSGWSFAKGVKFAFPEKTTLAPGGYLVVCRNKKAFVPQYGADLPTVGDFKGKLSHGGETLELVNARGAPVDVVTYSDREPWPLGADGYSSSLERICPSMPGLVPENWAASTLPPAESPAGTPGRRNDRFSTNLPPVFGSVSFATPRPAQPVAVTAEVSDPDGVQAVTLLYAVAKAGGQDAETEVLMQRRAGDERRGTFEGAIPGQPPGTLMRFRLRASDALGGERYQPSPHGPRPTYSCSTFVNTNLAQIGFAHVVTVQPYRKPDAFVLPGPRRLRLPVDPTRGNGAFIYLPPDGGEALTFDHVEVRPRQGGFSMGSRPGSDTEGWDQKGWKVHFQRDRPFKGMTGINLLFEGSPRWVLAEHLAYELYRWAGVPTPASEHLRLSYDGRLLGYHLLVEQPNKNFLARHQRAEGGNLYKLIWYHQGLVGQHEKKTNLTQGHDDVIAAVKGLERSTGAEQWAFIQKHFNVEEFISYFAVNMCIQNWDGFFNNYFTYHDTQGTGKWEIYPWDEDKTWGDYDGAALPYDWYEMPLTYGMKGDRQPRGGLFAFFGGGPSWWRAGGWFSAPMLANPEFRKRFLARLGEVCHQLFTEEKLLPIIDALEKRLAPEIPLRATALGEDAEQALKTFRADIQSFRDQVKHRRKFLLSELARQPR